MPSILNHTAIDYVSVGLHVKEYNNCWNSWTDIVHLFPIWTKMGGSDGVFVPLELLEELGILLHTFWNVEIGSVNPVQGNCERKNLFSS